MGYGQFMFETDYCQAGRDMTYPGLRRKPCWRPATVRASLDDDITVKLCGRCADVIIARLFRMIA